jgi:hypothetical protein
MFAEGTEASCWTWSSILLRWLEKIFVQMWFMSGIYAPLSNTVLVPKHFPYIGKVLLIAFVVFTEWVGSSGNASKVYLGMLGFRLGMDTNSLEIFHVFFFFQFLQANASIDLKWGHDCFLPYLLKFNIHSPVIQCWILWVTDSIIKWVEINKKNLILIVSHAVTVLTESNNWTLQTLPLDMITLCFSLVHIHLLWN